MFHSEAEQELLRSVVWDQSLRLSSNVSWEVSSAQCQRKGTFLVPAESEVCELLLSATKSSVVDGHLLAAAQELLGAVLEAGAFCVTVCCLNMRSAGRQDAKLYTKPSLHFLPRTHPGFS